MTGAELRAWRERLGKDEAWIEGMLRERIPGLGVGGQLDGTHRRQAAEGTRRGVYSDGNVYAIRAAYRTALEAEEARQAAERGPAEPVCPEGVKTWAGCGDGAGSANLTMAGQGFASLVVAADGSIRTGQYAPGVPVSPALLEYAAALSRYRAAVHAASDRQRKLDAVRAAEAEAERMIDARDTAHRRFLDADNLRAKAELALATARREAGL